MTVCLTNIRNGYRKGYATSKQLSSRAALEHFLLEVPGHCYVSELSPSLVTYLSVRDGSDLTDEKRFIGSIDEMWPIFLASCYYVALWKNIVKTLILASTSPQITMGISASSRKYEAFATEVTREHNLLHSMSYTFEELDRIFRPETISPIIALFVQGICPTEETLKLHVP